MNKEKEKNKCPYCMSESFPEEGYSIIWRCTGCGAILDIEQLI